ncbi:hypothetical protein H4217_006282 [Coemansia sp. RSA 1939]|nr:hypothetical protein H4217_006282 [Coemansia sp. RSA 1939]
MAAETNPSLFVATSDFFENLPFPPTSVPPRPPSIPNDLEPAPLFPSTSSTTNALEAAFLSIQQPHATHGSNALGLTFGSGSAAFNNIQHSNLPPQQQQQQQQRTQLGHPQQISVLQPTSSTLFDPKEESYLNSFLSGFDIEGFEIAPYLASPLPMASFSSRADFGSMGMGMGVGAGMMGAMDDAIPHLSLDDGRNDTTSGLTRMAASSSAGVGGVLSRATAGDTPMFEYGLGGTSHLSLGNVISEEMHKVSSWLLQSQDHHGEPPQTAGSAFSDVAAMSQRMSIDMHHPQSQPQPYPPFPSGNSNTSGMQHLGSAQASISGAAYRMQYSGVPSMTIPQALSQDPHTAAMPMWQGDSGADATSMQSPRPVSESDMSIKRKASFEQLGQPRKTRGSMRSPINEPHTQLSAGGVHSVLSRAPAILEAVSAGSIAARRSIPRGAASTSTSADARSKQTVANAVAESAAAPGSDSSDDEDGTGEISGTGAKRKEGKKSTPRAVLTEEERRANHIASEQRRRNQIRHGYAELMTLVTTLRDPALGNHPGTAHSTPSKAVILAHAVQFIRGLEEGNRMLRKRLEQTHRLIPPIHMASHALPTFHPGSPTPPQL